MYSYITIRASERYESLIYIIMDVVWTNYYGTISRIDLTTRYRGS